MSTTQDTFTEVDNTCPHGKDIESKPLSCWFCRVETDTGAMAPADPRREA